MQDVFGFTVNYSRENCKELGNSRGQLLIKILTTLFFQLQQTLRPISEGFQGQEKIENMAILRRKSTGSFDDSSRNSRSFKHSVSTISSTLQRRNSMTMRSKKGISSTKWYHEQENQNEFNKSRNSLETDDSEESIFNSEEDLEIDQTDVGLMSKLFHSTPTLKRKSEDVKPYTRPRAPTNDKLEKYKFLLINIEQDSDILDPGTFGLLEDSYLGFEFNDYPSEVLCPNPTQCQELPVEVQKLKPAPSWIRRSFETLQSEKSSKTFNSNISQSTGNLAELKKSETDHLKPQQSETRSSIELQKEPENNAANANKDTGIQEDIRRLLATGSPTLTECL